MRWDQRAEKGRFQDKRQAQNQKRKMIGAPPLPEPAPPPTSEWSWTRWPDRPIHTHGPVTYYAPPGAALPSPSTLQPGTMVFGQPGGGYMIMQNGGLIQIQGGAFGGVSGFGGSGMTYQDVMPDPDEIERQSLRDQLRALQAGDG
jgi:hypothetical protein